MQGLQNQCSCSVLPQPRSCPRSGASLSSTISQQTLNGFPGPRRCGASPTGILRRGTGRGTILLLHGSVRAFVQCCVVGGAIGVFSGVAVCQCVWLVTGLRGLVMEQEVAIHTAVVGGLLCFLCVQLDAVLQLCVCPPDGRELHVTYCGFGFRDGVGDDPVELEWYRSPEHRLLDLRLPHQGTDLICPRRDRARSGVLYYGVLRCPRSQAVASLSQRALFEVLPHLRLLQLAGAYGVFGGYVYTW